MHCFDTFQQVGVGTRSVDTAECVQSTMHELNWSASCCQIAKHYHDKGMVPASPIFKSGPKVLKILFEARSPDTEVHQLSLGGSVDLSVGKILSIISILITSRH